MPHRDAGQGRQGHRTSRAEQVPVATRPAEPAAEAHDDAGEPLVGHQHVGALADHRDRDARHGGGLADRRQRGVVLGVDEQRSGAADPERRQRSDREPHVERGPQPCAEGPLGIGEVRHRPPLRSGRAPRRPPSRCRRIPSVITRSPRTDLIRQERDRVLPVGRVDHGVVRGRRPDAVDHEGPRDPRDRRLVRPVHVGHDDRGRRRSARRRAVARAPASSSSDAAGRPRPRGPAAGHGPPRGSRRAPSGRARSRRRTGRHVRDRAPRSDDGRRRRTRAHAPHPARPHPPARRPPRRRPRRGGCGRRRSGGRAAPPPRRRGGIRGRLPDPRW